MGDVLSQNEIDNLLQALSSGELDAEEIKDSDEKQIKNYDFARPAKFSKEHLRTLEIIFEHYGRLFNNKPSGLSAKGNTGRSNELRGSIVFRVLQCTIKSGFIGNH